VLDACKEFAVLLTKDRCCVNRTVAAGTMICKEGYRVITCHADSVTQSPEAAKVNGNCDRCPLVIKLYSVRVFKTLIKFPLKLFDKTSRAKGVSTAQQSRAMKLAVTDLTDVTCKHILHRVHLPVEETTNGMGYLDVLDNGVDVSREVVN